MNPQAAPIWEGQVLDPPGRLCAFAIRFSAHAHHLLFGGQPVREMTTVGFSLALPNRVRAVLDFLSDGTVR